MPLTSQEKDKIKTTLTLASAECIFYQTTAQSLKINHQQAEGWLANFNSTILFDDIEKKIKVTRGCIKKIQELNNNILDLSDDAVQLIRTNKSVLRETLQSINHAIKKIIKKFILLLISEKSKLSITVNKIKFINCNHINLHLYDGDLDEELSPVIHHYEHVNRLLAAYDEFDRLYVEAQARYHENLMGSESFTFHDLDAINTDCFRIIKKEYNTLDTDAVCCIAKQTLTKLKKIPKDTYIPGERKPEAITVSRRRADVTIEKLSSYRLKYGPRFFNDQRVQQIEKLTQLGAEQFTIEKLYPLNIY